MFELKNGDLVVFDTGKENKTAFYTDKDGQKYFTFGTVEEGYLPNYHNSMIQAVIRDNVYHAINNTDKIQLIVDGIKNDNDYVMEYLYDNDLWDRLNRTNDKLDKIMQLVKGHRW